MWCAKLGKKKIEQGGRETEKEQRGDGVGKGDPTNLALQRGSV